MNSTRPGQVLALRTFSDVPDNAESSASNGSRRNSLNSGASGSEPRPEEPTRAYQCLIVFAGFMMIFHTIGINSIYALFQVGPHELSTIITSLTHHTDVLAPQEFYTSAETNIKDAQGQEALVSLVGTIGSGLTWSGCIFVNPMIPRGNVKLITLVGSFIMSVGIVLASFCNQVRPNPYYSSKYLPTEFDAIALAAVPDPRTPLRHWLQHVLLPPHVRDTYILRQEQRCRNGYCRFRCRCWGSRPVPRLPRPPDPSWDTLVSSFTGPLELCRQHPYCQRIEEARGGRCYWSIPSQHGNSEARHVHNAGMSLAPVSSVRTLNAVPFPFGKYGQSVGAFLQAAGNNVPNYYLTTYSVSVLSYSSSTGSLLLALNTAANTVARIVMGVLADRVGRQNTMILSVSPSSLCQLLPKSHRTTQVIFSAVSVFALWYDSDRARFLAFIVLYGVLAGGYSALFPTTIPEIYGIQNYASVNSAIYFIRGLGVLCGAPIAGVILGSGQLRGSDSSPSRSSQMLGLEALKTRYNDVATFDGVILLAGGLCVAYVRWLDARDKGGWSWRA